MSLNNLDDLETEYSAIALAEDCIDSGYLLFLQVLKLSQMADEIAYETQSLRAISLAASLKKDVSASFSALQAYRSKQTLITQGIWYSDTLPKFNLDLFIQQNQNK